MACPTPRTSLRLASLSGVIIILITENFFSVSNLTYVAGHAYQEAGDVNVTNVDQKSYFVNLGFDTPIAANWSLDGLFEYMYIQNVDGSAGSDTYYFTAIGTATCNEN